MSATKENIFHPRAYVGHKGKFLPPLRFTSGIKVNISHPQAYVYYKGK
jgi:hypothetical protein